MREGLILKITCPDKPGLVARIANHASEFQANLEEFNQFIDRDRKTFYARLEIDTGSLEIPVADFIASFEVLGRQFRRSGISGVFPTR